MPFKPVAVESLLRWIICGNVENNDARFNVNVTNLIKTSEVMDTSIDFENSDRNVGILREELKGFWEVELH